VRGQLKADSGYSQWCTGRNSVSIAREKPLRCNIAPIQASHTYQEGRNDYLKPLAASEIIDRHMVASLEKKLEGRPGWNTGASVDVHGAASKTPSQLPTTYRSTLHISI
jgi:hypothetical protein